MGGPLIKTIEILKQFITDELVSDFNPSDLDENKSLLESGIIDSLGIMKLVAFIQERFQLEVSDEELIPENFETSSALTKFISQK